MNAIETTIARIEKMQSSVEEISKEEFIKEAALFSDLNRDQLSKGITALGDNMPTYASSNKKTGKINLFDKGDFHQGIKPLFDNEGVDMTSTDSKVAFLDPKFNTALGINDNSAAILVEKVIPKVQNRLKKL